MKPALWFFDHGVHVFPVNGKQPAVPKGTSQYDYRCPRAHAATFTSYGVPLGRCRSGWLTVADTDGDDAERCDLVALPVGVKVVQRVAAHGRRAPLGQVHGDAIGQRGRAS